MKNQMTSFSRSRKINKFEETFGLMNYINVDPKNFYDSR